MGTEEDVTVPTYSIIRVAELLSEMYKMEVENINFFLKIGISTGKENGNDVY